METNRLGRSDLEVSRVGLGCNNFGGRLDRDATAAVVSAALDAGITFFDTADTYGGGDSERFLGEALADRRDDVVIASKFGQDKGVPGPGGSRARLPWVHVPRLLLARDEAKVCSRTIRAPRARPEQARRRTGVLWFTIASVSRG